eukprot:CAMPEP_0175127684 /NCGR_PEP_ID=MMETSP0087-20121206/4518_1 /TAXON_ID=136419 /ORGANISM="Unknown Unknown, Strain D1" /LENGTH=246 /DNA_ID=CAMNT_0016409679 /DNA_START=39 /DNA_END=779 /DNA_ORIENTATION=-
MQAAGWAYSSYHQTEKIYDATGALTFQTCTLAALASAAAAQNCLYPRQILAGGCVLLWSARLGLFLHERVKRHPDKRFDKIKKDPVSFAGAWFLQGCWVAVTALPPLLVIASRLQPPLGLLDLAGAGLFCAGLAVETTADAQKQAFKRDHPDCFCDTGLWRYCRYPNYFGEVSLWCGVSMLCWTGLAGKGRRLAALVSPVLLAALIVNVSGVKLSEESQRARYGHLQSYQKYVLGTSKYVPWFSSR